MTIDLTLRVSVATLRKINEGGGLTDTHSGMLIAGCLYCKSQVRAPFRTTT